MNDQRLSNNLFNSLGWVQRLIWILKDHLNPLPDFLALSIINMRDIFAFKNNASLGGFFESHQGK